MSCNKGGKRVKRRANERTFVHFSLEQGRIHDCSCRGWLGRGSNDLGRGSNDFGGGNNDLGRDMLK